MFVETERTFLRNFIESDLQDVWEYSSQDGVGEAAGWLHHHTIAETRAALAKDIQNRSKYAIILRKNKKVIGYLAVNEDSEDHRADTKELGCVLNRAYQRQGIMTEVIRAVLEELFSQEIAYVYACCFQENTASKHMIEKSAALLLSRKVHIMLSHCRKSLKALSMYGPRNAGLTNILKSP